MRFINLVVALAGVVTALQDGDSSAANFAGVQARAKTTTTTARTSTTTKAAAAAATACTNSKRFMPRGEFGSYDEKSNTWTLDMNDYCEAELVEDGAKVVISNVSGCSAVFFFGSDGKPTAYHVEAGKESTEGKEAAKIAVEQKSTSSCTIYAYEQAKATVLQTAFKAAGYTTTCKYVPYKLDTSNNKARWRFSLTVPSTTVTAAAYTCS
ncbi:unnamed protein product [Discula destructiva]